MLSIRETMEGLNFEKAERCRGPLCISPSQFRHPQPDEIHRGRQCDRIFAAAAEQLFPVRLSGLQLGPGPAFTAVAAGELYFRAGCQQYLLPHHQPVLL